MTVLEQTADILRPWLGSAFVASNAELMQRLSLRLSLFLPGRDSLRDSATDMDSLLFMAVRNQTAGRMTLPMDNGQSIRVKLNDFSVMADELLYILMANLERNDDSFRLLREYSIRYSSLSALKALFLHYESFQGAEEYRTVVRVIKTCHPAFRWQGWLQP